MIVVGTYPPINIDFGSDEPGMTLQRWGREWVDYKIDNKVVKSPVDIDALPAGRYRLVKRAASDWRPFGSANLINYENW